MKNRGFFLQLCIINPTTACTHLVRGSHTMQPIPADVTEWIRTVFRECNERITEKLSNNPNLPEESLDLTWIEHLSQYASPVTLGSLWTVKIETHYLGGLRHFRNWEIADIGVLMF